MIRFLIQKINGEIRHDFSLTLMESIRFRNWLQNADKIKYRFLDTTEDAIDFKFKPLHRHYVPVGSVEFVSAFLKQFYGLTPKPINVPEELFSFPFTHRYITNGRENDLRGKQFVKSNDKIKGFCGILNEGEPYTLPEGNYQYSDVISIDSEWRGFVYNGKLVGLQNYSGEFTKFPNVVKIKTMIDVYKSAPIAYTLDVGVNDHGTFIIEVHDFFSCGLYGFADHAKYPSMLHRWFWEYTQREFFK